MLLTLSNSLLTFLLKPYTTLCERCFNFNRKMKKWYLSITFIFLLGSMQAQFRKEGFKEQVVIGVKVGPVMSTFSNNADAKPFIGIYTGLFAAIKITDKYALQPEIAYTSQGAKFDTGDVNLNYIIIPMILKHYVADRIIVEVGTQMSFLTSTRSTNSELLDSYNKIDFAANIGLSYYLNPKMMLGFRYCLGLARIEKIENPTKSSVIQLTFGYHL